MVLGGDYQRRQSETNTTRGKRRRREGLVKGENRTDRQSKEQGVQELIGEEPAEVECIAAQGLLSHSEVNALTSFDAGSIRVLDVFDF